MSSESHNHRYATSARPQLYVVWEIDDRDPEDTRRTAVTDPKLLAEAEQFAEREARHFAGRLEVAPARPEDLDDADDEARAYPVKAIARPWAFLLRDAWDYHLGRLLVALLSRLAPAPVRHLAWLAGFSMALGEPQPHFWLEHLPEHLAGNKAAWALRLRARVDRGPAMLGRLGQVLSEVHETTRDQAMYDVGRMVLDLRRDGLDDRDVLDTVLEMAQLRMMAGLDDAVDVLAGGEAA